MTFALKVMLLHDNNEILKKQFFYNYLKNDLILKKNDISFNFILLNIFCEKIYKKYMKIIYIKIEKI